MPTSVHFYARQPVGAALHGTINMESLLINVNASIIRSISKIMNQLTESTTDVSLMPQGDTIASSSKALDSVESEDFWTVKPIKDSDIPVSKQSDYESTLLVRLRLLTLLNVKSLLLHLPTHHYQLSRMCHSLNNFVLTTRLVNRVVLKVEIDAENKQFPYFALL